MMVLLDYGIFVLMSTTCNSFVIHITEDYTWMIIKANGLLVHSNGDDTITGEGLQIQT